MGWYKDIKIVLDQEPEVWLSYLYGQQLENLPHLTRTKPKYRGAIIQVAKFFGYLLRDLQFRQTKKNAAPVSFFVFFGTLNQKKSLNPTINSLNQRGETVAVIAPESLIKEEGDGRTCFSLKYSFSDVCKALFLFAVRGPALYRDLRKIHPVAISWYLSNFCSSYAFLSFFQRQLTRIRPDFVVTANDHNTPNRCMLAMAHHLGIKTVYLQHASVSNLFPALRVRYAFLDGQSALDTYQECEANQPDNPRNVPEPEVFLTGQKKHLIRNVKSENNTLGVALNALDEPSAAIRFVNDLVDKGCQVHLRWHPGQPLRDIEEYTAAFCGAQCVTLSNPNCEDISVFLEKIGFLIAGNSSVHLEAALSGVTPIYYEITQADTPDYYGYVKSGLAIATVLISDIVDVVNGRGGHTRSSVNIVRYYSATYLTEWDGREGELVGECLFRIARSYDLPIEGKSLI